jgi:hypothetical protein
MKAEFTIDNSYVLVCELGFFYLFNFNYDNVLAYANYREKKHSYRGLESCVGVWKFKQFKQ